MSSNRLVAVALVGFVTALWYPCQGKTARGTAQSNPIQSAVLCLHPIQLQRNQLIIMPTMRVAGIKSLRMRLGFFLLLSGCVAIAVFSDTLLHKLIQAIPQTNPSRNYNFTLPHPISASTLQSGWAKKNITPIKMLLNTSCFGLPFFAFLLSPFPSPPSFPPHPSDLPHNYK